MKLRKLVLCPLLFAMSWLIAAQEKYPKARITARVLDEENKPLENAKVRFVFCSAENASAIVPVEGLTDSDGLFSGEGHSSGSYGVTIKKDGYYSSGLGAPRLADVKEGRWLPWDPVVATVLRPIGKVVPLYVKAAWVEIPLIGVPCGYDLSKGDWVSPYGDGLTSDLFFTLQRQDQGQRALEIRVRITFSQPADGIQEIKLPEAARYSAFKWPRLAPMEGYLRVLEKSFTRDPKNGFSQDASEEEAYFFRVRTIQENGQTVSALYGKIKGGFFLAPLNTKTCKVRLIYYLNPTSLDRNTEWDPAHNLLTNVNYEEMPREP